MRWSATALAVFLALPCLFVLWAEGGEDAPKFTIKQVMDRAHKPPEHLLRKVAQGQASAAEKAELVKLYKALAKSDPPKGSKADWEKRTKLLVEAAEAAQRGDRDADRQLTKASNCMACHKDHK